MWLPCTLTNTVIGGLSCQALSELRHCSGASWVPRDKEESSLAEPRQTEGGHQGVRGAGQQRQKHAAQTRTASSEASVVSAPCLTDRRPSGARGSSDKHEAKAEALVSISFSHLWGRGQRCCMRPPKLGRVRVLPYRLTDLCPKSQSSDMHCDTLFHFK